MGLFRKKKETPTKRASLTGQANKGQKVFSYYTASHQKLSSYERRNEASQEETANKSRRRSVRNHWFIYFSIIALVVTLGYSAILNINPQITVEGTAYRTDSAYAQIANEQLAKSPFNRTKITLQRSQLSKNISAQIPEAKQVRISAPLLGHRPNITIITDEPAAVLQQPGGQDLIVSQRGRLLIAISQSSGTTDLPIITNNSVVIGKAGEQFFSPKDMESISQLMNQIKADNSQASFIIPPTPREIILLEPSRGVYQVKLLLGDTMLKQFGALRAAQKKLQEQGQTPSEYIDVRLADKVFYK